MFPTLADIINLDSEEDDSEPDAAPTTPLTPNPSRRNNLYMRRSKVRDVVTGLPIDGLGLFTSVALATPRWRTRWLLHGALHG